MSDNPIEVTRLICAAVEDGGRAVRRHRPARPRRLPGPRESYRARCEAIAAEVLVKITAELAKLPADVRVRADAVVTHGAEYLVDDLMPTLPGLDEDAWGTSTLITRVAALAFDEIQRQALDDDSYEMGDVATAYLARLIEDPARIVRTQREWDAMVEGAER